MEQTQKLKVIGFYLRKETLKGFVAICKDGKNHELGYYDNEIKAFLVYKAARENYLKEKADKWKDFLDVKAYNALMNYQVEITD